MVKYLFKIYSLKKNTLKLINLTYKQLSFYQSEVFVNCLSWKTFFITFVCTSNFLQFTCKYIKRRCHSCIAGSNISSLSQLSSPLILALLAPSTLSQLRPSQKRTQGKGTSSLVLGTYSKISIMPAGVDSSLFRTPKGICVINDILIFNIKTLTIIKLIFSNNFFSVFLN